MDNGTEVDFPNARGVEEVDELLVDAGELKLKPEDFEVAAANPPNALEAPEVPNNDVAAFEEVTELGTKVTAVAVVVVVVFSKEAEVPVFEGTQGELADVKEAFEDANKEDDVVVPDDVATGALPTPNDKLFAVEESKLNPDEPEDFNPSPSDVEPVVEVSDAAGLEVAEEPNEANPEAAAEGLLSPCPNANVGVPATGVIPNPSPTEDLEVVVELGFTVAAPNPVIDIDDADFGVADAVDPKAGKEGILGGAEVFSVPAGDIGS